jgi:hypothetical protein
MQEEEFRDDQQRHRLASHLLPRVHQASPFLAGKHPETGQIEACEMIVGWVPGFARQSIYPVSDFWWKPEEGDVLTFQVRRELTKLGDKG